MSCRRCHRRLRAVQSLWRQLIGLLLNVAWPVCADNVNVPTATTPVDVVVTIMSAGDVIIVATNDHQMRQIFALHILLTILHQLFTFCISHFYPTFSHFTNSILQTSHHHSPVMCTRPSKPRPRCLWLDRGKVARCLEVASRPWHPD